MATYIFASEDSSAADKAAASSGCLYNGSAWSQAQKDIFSTSNQTTIEVRPGTYEYEGTLQVGSNTTLRGSRAISIPTTKRDLVVANPAIMAVFKSKQVRGSEVEVPTSYHADVETVPNATNVHISDIYMAGYCVLKLQALKQSDISRVLVHNYHGSYPNGTWANMGYGDATGSVWLQGACEVVELDQVISQFSSHHGFCIHYPDSAIAKSITFIDCRAISCGCGMLKGETSGDIATSEAVPELKFRNGRGYMDWSVGFDLNENIQTHDIEARDCYAYDCWKAGFYQEPGKHAYDHRLIRCVAEANGVRANLATGMMIPMESEHSNFYLQTGTLTDCISRNGSKAGFLLNPEFDFTPGDVQNARKYDGKFWRVLMVGCIDCGSKYGVIVGPGGAKDVRMDNCYFINNTKRAMNIFGTGPFVVRNVKIRTDKPTTIPIVLGRYCRANRALSLSSSNRQLFTEGLSIGTSMSGLEISGTIEGLQAGTPVCMIQSSNVNGTRVAPPSGFSVTAASTTIDTSICTAVPDGGGGGEVPGETVEASFSVAPSSGSAPLAVQFHDTSAGTPIAWEWSFGDGGTSTAQHPVHTYTVPGTYPVTLTARNASSSDTEPRLNCVRVYEGSAPPDGSGTARFVLSDLGISPSIVRPGEVVTITFRVGSA